MFQYRPDQGIYARGTAFWAISAYSFLAGRSLYFWSQRFDWANSHLTAEKVPVLGTFLTPALLIGTALCLGLVWLVAWRVANTPKLADLLIDTEAEMKKVTWPSWEDTKRSSLVVIGCVAFLLAYLFSADAALKWLFFRVIL